MRNLQALETEVLSLDKSERGYLVDILLSSFEQNELKEDFIEYDKEIKRRIKSIDNGSILGIPSEMVHSKIRSKYV